MCMNPPKCWNTLAPTLLQIPDFVVAVVVVLDCWMVDRRMSSGLLLMIQITL